MLMGCKGQLQYFHVQQQHMVTVAKQTANFAAQII